MKTVTKISAASKRILTAFTFVLGFISFNSRAQSQSQNQEKIKPQTQLSAPDDTINIIQYSNDLNFDTKRSVIYTDKHSVDSLATVLATNDKTHYRIVYRREGKQGAEITPKALGKLDRSGLYRIMIAYNKKGLPGDDMPIYVLTSK